MRVGGVDKNTQAIVDIGVECHLHPVAGGLTHVLLVFHWIAAGNDARIGNGGQQTLVFAIEQGRGQIEMFTLITHAQIEAAGFFDAITVEHVLQCDAAGNERRAVVVVGVDEGHVGVRPQEVAARTGLQLGLRGQIVGQSQAGQPNGVSFCFAVVIRRADGRKR